MKKYRAALWGVGILAPCLSVPACDEAAECPKCSEAGPCLDSGVPDSGLPCSDSGPCADSGVPDGVTPDVGGGEAGTSDAGQLQGWAISGGGDVADRSHAIILDRLGNLVVAGQVKTGTTTGTFGSFDLKGAGGDDIFLGRVTVAGQVTGVTLTGTKDNEALEAVTMDTAGNLLLGGYFTGSATFGSTTLKSNGFSDFLVARMTSGGTYDWAMSAGSVTNSDYTKALAADSKGNVYVGGTFADTMTFNGQTYTNPKGSKRAFLFKLSNLGKVVWVHVFTGGPIQSVGGVVLDTAGNVHVAGSFKGTLGHGSKTLTATGRDAYLAKLDSAGKVLWVSQVTGPGDCHAYRLAMDAKDHPVIVGYFDGATATFGSITVPTTGTAKESDVFVSKLTSTGAFSWAASAGGAAADTARGLAIDAGGNIFLAGTYTGTASFGKLSLTGVSASGSDVFVARMSSGGSFVKVTSAGGATGSVEATDMVVDNSGGAYITGVFSGSVSFAGHTLTAGGTTNDIFVWKAPTL